MTNYNLKPIIPTSPLAQQKKEARKKVLEAVRKRRKLTSQRFQQKRQLQVSSENDTIAELC